MTDWNEAEWRHLAVLGALERAGRAGRLEPVLATEDRCDCCHGVDDLDPDGCECPCHKPAAEISSLERCEAGCISRGEPDEVCSVHGRSAGNGTAGSTP